MAPRSRSASRWRPRTSTSTRSTWPTRSRCQPRAWRHRSARPTSATSSARLLLGLELCGAEPGDRRDARSVAAVAAGHHDQLVGDAGLGERLAERLGGRPEIELVVVSDRQVDVAAEYLQRADAPGIA